MTKKLQNKRIYWHVRQNSRLDWIGIFSDGADRCLEC